MKNLISHKKSIITAMCNLPSTLLILTTSIVILISLGWLIGNTPNSLEFLNLMWAGLSIIGSIATCIATITAVVIAAKALTTWQDQFKHEEKYRLISQLENAFQIYLDSFDFYLEAHMWKLRYEEGAITNNKDIDEMVNNVDSLFKKYNDNYYNVIVEYERIEQILNQPDDFPEPFMESSDVLCSAVIQSVNRVGYDFKTKSELRKHSIQVLKDLRMFRSPFTNS